jgi:outer membrane protein TolC
MLLLAGCSSLPRDNRRETNRPAESPPRSVATLRSSGPSGEAPIATVAAQTPEQPVPETNLGSQPPPPPKALPEIPGTPVRESGELLLADVLESVDRHYPLLRAIEYERIMTGGRLISAMGVFDFNLQSNAISQTPATYDNFVTNFGVRQYLPVGGASAFAGYRIGQGRFPTYDLSQFTAEGGEFRAGFSLPLLRDREIDRPRATVQQAQLDYQIAEPVIERQQIDFQRAAARTYWNWVGSGMRLRITERLVKLAADRDEQLKARVAIGPVANIERIDNQQNIAQRNAMLVQAQRAFQQATIELSLFLRTDDGQPLLAGSGRLPSFPEVDPPGEVPFDSVLKTAFEQRPEPRRLRLQREKFGVELRLAMNQTMANVDAMLMATQDIGGGFSSLSGPANLNRQSVSAGLQMALPVQRREARGRVIQAQAQIAQLDHQIRFTEDAIRAEVQETFTAVERAYEFVKQAKQRVELALVVARAEQELLRQGRSDILRVTLREQAAFDAALIEISAQQDYFRAQADFRAAQGFRDIKPAK